MVLCSAHEERNALHTQGTALMLSKEAQKAHIGWESHESTIIKTPFKAKKGEVTMNLIQCYAPINDGNKDYKD